MNRSIVLLLPSLALFACNRTAGVQETQEYFPIATLEAGTVEFGSVAWGDQVSQAVVLRNDGDLPMGIGEIYVGEDGMEDNWSLTVDWSALRCDGDTGSSGDGGTGDGGTGDGGTDDGGTDDGGGSGDGGSGDGGSGDGGSGDGGTDSGGSSDSGSSDSGSSDSGSSDSGGGTDTGADTAPEGPTPVPADTGDYYGGGDDDDEDEDRNVIDPGCELPIQVTLEPERVGDIWGSVRIETITETVRSEDAEPTYWADPDNAEVVALVHGLADKGAPDIYIRPRAVDFGHLWEGESDTALVDVSNTGEGELELGEPYLGESCDPGFSITESFDSGEIIAGGAKTYIELTFDPEDDSSASCTLWIPSNDPDEPNVDVPIQANTGSDPSECAPEIDIISPEVGYQHLDGDDLTVRLKVEDCNQSAETLAVQLRSGVQWPENPVLVDTFYPEDESGYVEVDIPRKKLGSGTDTLIARVRDDSGNIAYDSTTFLYLYTYPDADDDGDGYGNDDETAASYDCDDSDKATFPGAIEIYDGKDNDCDGEIDEDTEGTDDDGDGYTEAEGDCDDTNADSNPDAEEVPDYLDNDCDGLVDENTTLSDDDGDGFAEADGDCDDRDAAVSPTAVEYCDGIDNDCNGLSDEQDGCVDLSAAPMIIGGVREAADTIRAGESVILSVFAYDPDGESTSYIWTPDPKLTNAGIVALDNQTAATVTFTAPAELPGGAEQARYTFLVQVADPAGRTDFDSQEILVKAEGVETYRIVETSVESSGCSTSGRTRGPLGALAAFGMMGLAALGLRRRD